MTTELNKNILIFLLASIALIVFPHLFHLPTSIFSFICVMIGWRFAGIWKPNWLPNHAVITLLITIGIALLYNQHQPIYGRDGGTNLFIIALGFKLMEIKSERELYLVNYLAFIVAASQFLFEQSLVMAVYVLAVCCVLLGTLVTINSLRPQTALALKTAGLLLVQALPLAAALFVLFPRVEAPRWMLFSTEKQHKAGLSDSMEPGSITNLGENDELVFRATFTGAIPERKLRYWRGPVLSRTDGKRWTQVAKLAFTPISVAPKVRGTAYQYTLLMEPQEKRWVFALDMPKEFSQPLAQNANYQLISRLDLERRVEFVVTSYPEYNTGELSPLELETSTDIPGQPSGKIKQLVTQLHGFDAGPEVFIAQLLNHFRQEDFHYTLTPPLMEENPIETFLFKTRYGFCSHYASAFVYLMRVAHIPARVVTGYQGGEYNPVGNFIEVKQADAHAWAEVWLENKGWTRVDPTAAIAPERIERGINFDELELGGVIRFQTSEEAQAAVSWLKKTAQLWDSVDYQWQRWVINYNSQNQADFLSLFGINDMRTMVYWMAGILAFISIPLSFFLLMTRQKSTDKLFKIYDHFCRKLEKHGLVRGVSEGARDFGERAKLALPEKAADINEITQTFIRLRYGRNPNQAEWRVLRDLVAKFKP